MTTPLAREQVRAIDRIAQERFHVPGIVLMENAGRNAAAIVCEQLGSVGKAWIVCGVGNNGGDGCVIARYLANDGWHVQLLIAGDTAKAAPDMRTNFEIARAMDLPVTVAAYRQDLLAAVSAVQADAIIIDALLGTGFRGTVRAPTDALVNAINAARKRAVVAVDLPSGLDCDTGEPSNATIRADLTVTFVAEKIGFAAPGAAAYTGRVVVADIGVPRAAIRLVLETSKNRRPAAAKDPPPAV